jgi:MscS family membrane protein
MFSFKTSLVLQGLKVHQMFKLFQILVLLYLFFPFTVWGQIPEDDEENLLSFESPYHAIQAHLYYLNDNSYRPEFAARALYPKNKTGQSRKELAISLKQIYAAKGILPDADRLPRNPNYLDSITGKHRYYISPDLPGIYVQKSGQRWYYSKKSTELIPVLHKELYPFGTDQLLKLIPDHSRDVFGIQLWKLVGILILTIAAVILHKLFTWIFDLLLSRLATRLGHGRIAHSFIRPVAIPFSLFFIFLLLIVFVPLLQLPFRTNYYLLLVIKALLPLFMTIVFYKAADVVAYYLMKLAERTESTLDDQLVPLVRRVMKIFVIVVGGLFALQNLNFDVTALIAGLSIGGLAFALAAQDTIKNLFGSLMIFIDKPFQIGQWIKANEIDGEIEEVGFRSTRIRTFANSLITVPNGKLADMVIDNMGMRNFRRMQVNLTLVYGTPLDQIRTYVESLRQLIEGHPKTRKDNYQVHFNNMSSYSYDILFYVYLAAPTWREELNIRQEILMGILELAEKQGIKFAFPTQTLLLDQQTPKEK